MSMISKRGQEVKDAVNKDNIDLKKVFEINKGVYYENFYIGTNCTDYRWYAF